MRDSSDLIGSIFWSGFILSVYYFVPWWISLSIWGIGVVVAFAAVHRRVRNPHVEGFVWSLCILALLWPAVGWVLYVEPAIRRIAGAK